MHKVKFYAAALVGLLVALQAPQSRDERGLSQSAETAILIAGAVTVGAIVVGLITVFVRSKLGNL